MPCWSAYESPVMVALGSGFVAAPFYKSLVAVLAAVAFVAHWGYCDRKYITTTTTFLFSVDANYLSLLK